MQFGSSPAGAAKPGGGIGEPIGSPDTLTGTKGWLLLGGGVLLTGTGWLILRRRKEAQIFGVIPFPYEASNDDQAPSPVTSISTIPDLRASSALLDSLKEELFALEQEGISGRISEGRLRKAETRP